MRTSLIDGNGDVIDPKRIEALASRGLNLKQIGLILGFTRKADMTDLRKAHPEIEEAWERGRAKGVAVVANAFMREVLNGNLRAMEVYLRTHGGWNDQPMFPRPSDLNPMGEAEKEAEQKDGQQQHGVLLLPAPGGMTAAEWEKQAREYYAARRSDGKPPAEPEPAA